MRTRRRRRAASAASAASLADRMDGLSVSSPSDERSERVERSDAPSTVTWDDFLAARVRVRPSALREVAVEVPKVAWDDVGGLGDVKQRLKEAVEWSERHPDAMSRVGAKPPKGILLYGPPGCSKTMLARAVASASGRNFLTVKGPELYSKWVGDSEKAVRSLFARARASAPSVVFLDELDGLVGARSSGGGEGPSVHDRLLTQLLSEMDGLQTGRGDASDAVAVVAATNRPDLVDAALLRPGRFDRLLFIPPPRAAEDRAEILRVKLRRTPVGADVNLDMLATATHGYTGADLAAVCREAALAALEENIDAKEVCEHSPRQGGTPPAPPPAKTRGGVRKFEPGAGSRRCRRCRSRARARRGAPSRWELDEHLWRLNRSLDYARRPRAVSKEATVTTSESSRAQCSARRVARCANSGTSASQRSGMASAGASVDTTTACGGRVDS